MREIPYIYDELVAIFHKVGISLDGVYALNLETNLPEGNEGTLTVWRYKLHKKRPYLDRQKDEPAKEDPVTYEVLTLNRGREATK